MEVGIGPTVEADVELAVEVEVTAGMRPEVEVAAGMGPEVQVEAPAARAKVGASMVTRSCYKHC